jgi:leader peptidase (prepilin peptidase)/N-methyltransferase
MFFAFLIGAVVGILMLITKKATRKSAIPFGPFMIFGIWSSVLIGEKYLIHITKLWNI